MSTTEYTEWHIYGQVISPTMHCMTKKFIYIAEIYKKIHDIIDNNGLFNSFLCNMHDIYVDFNYMMPKTE